MSEPTVTIPIRLAFLAARWIAYTSYLGGTKGKAGVEEIKQELADAICDQCTQREIDVAYIAVKMQESQRA